MTKIVDARTVLRADSNDAANFARRFYQRHGIAVETSARLLSGSLPGAGFDKIAIMVGACNETAARELLDGLTEGITAHVERVETMYEVLEAKLSYVFKDRTILEQALTHRSKAREVDGGNAEDNESLEFLGDAVLGFVVADRLYRDCPDYDEGQKSKLKAELVSSAKLSEIGAGLALGDYLLLGRGELKSGGRHKPSLLANAMEAIIAAVYLDGGYEASVKCILHLFADEWLRLRREGTSGIGNKDYKSALQEWLQAKGRPLPVYRLANTSGPDHEKAFTIELRVDGDVIAIGEGRNKKEAEQCAADKALAVLASKP